MAAQVDSMRKMPVVDYGQQQPVVGGLADWRAILRLQFSEIPSTETPRKATIQSDHEWTDLVDKCRRIGREGTVEDWDYNGSTAKGSGPGLSARGMEGAKRLPSACHHRCSQLHVLIMCHNVRAVLVASMLGRNLIDETNGHCYAYCYC